MAISPTTELEAVNTILSTIGERSVASLDPPVTPDVEFAVQFLREFIRDVQLEGWPFNTLTDFKIERDDQGRLPLPPNTASVQFKHIDLYRYRPSIRGGFIFNGKDNSYTFPEDMTLAEIVLFLPFDELPESARRYITIRAAKKFQDRVQGSDAIHAYTTEDEARARAVLVQDAIRHRRPNAFNNYSFANDLRFRP